MTEAQKQAVVENFLKTPENISDEVLFIVNDIKRTNEINPFLYEFIQRNGMPVWGQSVGTAPIIKKVEKLQKGELVSNNANGQSTSTSSSALTLFVPLIDTISKEVKAYMYCQKNADGSTAYKTYNKNVLLGSNDSNKIKQKGILLSVFAHFDRKINNKSEISFSPQYRFKDVDLNFTTGTKNGIIVNNSLSEGLIKRMDASGGCVDGHLNISVNTIFGAITGNYAGYSPCSPYFHFLIVCKNGSPTLQYDGFIDPCPKILDGGGGSGGTGGTPPNTPPTVGTPPNNPSNPGSGIIDFWWLYGLPSPAPSPNPPPPNNGGGTGPNPGTNLPPNWQEDPNNPWFNDDGRNASGLVDENGYSIPRKQQLAALFLSNPYTLLPCDSLNIMPLDPDNGYGKMFQRIGQFKAPITLKNSLDSLNLVSPGVVDFVLGHLRFKLQEIENGTSTFPAVNCDYFPVRIKQLPPGFSPKDIVEYFRTHINILIGGSPNVTFNPYNFGNVNYTSKFNSSFEASIGSIIEINDHMVPIFPPVKASVLLSDYYINETPQQEKSRFKFTTIATPKTNFHPVSGNREFGIFADPSGNGEYVFYIMGVDRAHNITALLADVAGLGYERADVLWTKLQESMFNFINSNNGIAEFYGPKNIKARPKYADIVEFLFNQIDFTELKRRLGCL